MNLQNEINRIDRRRSELHAFIDEQQRAMKNDRFMWLFPASGMALGAAVFIAGIAFGKFILT